MSALHRLERTQVLPIPVEEAWAFFSDPRNLPRITPPDLRFQVTSELPDAMYEGLFISYDITPLLGVRMRWVTEITHIDVATASGERMFVDEQRLGPYRLWHHEHWFRALPGGTEMRDIVHYALPGGVLGAVAHALVVGQRVRSIFAYRRRVLESRFVAMAAGA